MKYITKKLFMLLFLLICQESAKAKNCPNGLTVTIAGGDRGGKYVPVGSTDNYTCIGSPSGGTYVWSCSDNLEIKSGQASSSIEVTATDISSALNDQYVKCVYTVNGNSCDEKYFVTSVKLTGKNLYWNGYDTDGSLLVAGVYSPESDLSISGISSGTLKWVITEGKEKLEMAKDNNPGESFSSSVTETGDFSVHIRAKGATDVDGQTTIVLLHNNVLVHTFSSKIRTPKTATIKDITHSAWAEYAGLVKISDGYVAVVRYELKDQYGDILRVYPVGEFFPDGWTSHMLNFWTSGQQGGGWTDNDGIFIDRIGISTYFLLDAPWATAPQSPLGSTLIRSIPQYLRAGKSSCNLSDSSAGVAIRTNILREYLDHASVVTDDVEYVE